MKTTLILPIAAASLFGSFANGALVFSEDFGTLANATTITTSNTDFTYARISTGTGTKLLQTINPSNVGTGASGYIEAPTTSLTGLGVGNTLTSSSLYSMSVDFRFTNVATGDIVFGVGAGSSFTGNSTFAGADGLFWLQSDNGNFERRAGSSWLDIGGGTSFSNATTYSLHVVANGSASSASYGLAESVAAGTMDIWLNGVKLDDNAAVTNSLAATGFRIYSISGTGIEMDNVQLWNEAVAPIPEPTAAVLGSLGLLSLLRRRR